MPAKKQPSLPLVLSTVIMTREERLAALHGRDPTEGKGVSQAVTGVSRNLVAAIPRESGNRAQVGGWSGTVGSSQFKSTDWSALAQASTSLVTSQAVVPLAPSSLPSRCASSPPRRPTRHDVPVVKRRKLANHNQVGELLDSKGIDACLNALDDDRNAASSSSSVADRVRTWSKFHLHIYGPTVPLLPLTVPTYKAVASVFKALGYRSFPNYASNIKAHHIELGHCWSDQLDQVAHWAARSVQRGIGPPRQSAPLG
jgi:hypothetical protein